MLGFLKNKLLIYYKNTYKIKQMTLFITVAQDIVFCL